MNDIGKVVKQIRNDKRITQQCAIEGIGSLTYISRIENGLTRPSYEKLIKILDRLNVTPTEFYRLIQQNNPNNQFSFINRLTNIIREKDIYLINREIEDEIKRYKEDKNYRHTHNVILLNQYRNLFLNFQLESQQISKLSDYLFKVRTWGIYEINLFNLCVVFFSNSNNQALFKIATARLGKLVNKDAYYTSVFRIGFNILLKTIESSDFFLSSLIIENLGDILDGTTFYYEIIKLKYMKGIYLMKKGNNKDGLELALIAVDLMYKLGDEVNARAHKKEIEKYYST
ncbi:helix-turn-helix domain-containing protein [Fundicoccus culcitae]|uniref:Helix-turn-helix domain-containing protein n=1 Tax=Fundicoccus culcitae TaxID=2969821 RepID=A0ABY5P6R0_9LACT|nr:Rgg/GadR/MutR family transcriptional regulator [Fundicoccus culcitae]UUX34369.1 helix-turn-helix domain-containing protein [Fundicoccus culcitae]